MLRILKTAISLALCLSLASVTSPAGVAASKASVISTTFNNNQNDREKEKYKPKVKNGLKGEYFNNVNFTSLKYTRIDKRVSFEWEKGSPAGNIGADSFSVRWSGQVQPRYTDTYTFHTIADDGVKLWINNQLIINDWSDHAATEIKGAITLEANKKYNIRLEYYDSRDDACVKLLWSSPRQSKEIIPEERLFSETGSTVPTPPSYPPANDREPVRVNLSAYYNEDAFSYDSDRGDGDYDGMASSYSANLFKSNPVYDGTAYATGPLDNGKNNAMHLSGQTIAVKQNKYESIRLLGSSTNGNKTGLIRVNYTDGTYSHFSLSMKDWCTSDITGEKVVQAMSHRHSGSSDEYINCYIYAYYLGPDKTKTVSSITMPDQKDMHVLALTLLPNIQSWSGTGNGLYGEYFDNANLTAAKLNRVDATINFDWGQGSPSSQMESDSFSARWSGQVEPRYSETYTFYTSSDDGVRLWVNNVLLINDWTEHSAAERSGAITLSAGTKYNIKLEYFENLDRASVKLMWSSSSQSKEVIPASQLYH
jgi:hypothetical protein